MWSLTLTGTASISYRLPIGRLWSPNIDEIFGSISFVFWGEINLFLHLILPTFSFRPNGGGRPYGSSPSSCSGPPRCFEAWKTRPCRFETWPDWRPSNFPLQLWRHAWIYPRLGILFTVKLLQFCFPGRGHEQRLANFQGQTSFRVSPKQILFVFLQKWLNFTFPGFTLPERWYPLSVTLPFAIKVIKGAN